jgi:ADP-ribosylglycohydrolase
MLKLEVDNYIGCLLGGAIGDALGAPTEFMTLKGILNKYGKQGVTDYVEFGERIGRITDDTQMTLFTAEGLLRVFNTEKKGGVRGDYIQSVFRSYLEWLQTQKTSGPGNLSGEYEKEGWLLTNKLLYKKRAPGKTCLDALQSGRCGSMEAPINNSKGCGGVMRVAPVGLVFNEDAARAFKVGAELAAITHGHPSGYLSAGTFSAVISCLSQGQELEEAIQSSIMILKQWKHHEEALAAVCKAINLFETTQPTFENVEKLGEGWIGEEALAISLYCALHYPGNFENAVLLSINHSGDTDSTGSMTGNISGLSAGRIRIPEDWILNLEMADTIIEIAQDLHRCNCLSP